MKKLLVFLSAFAIGVSVTQAASVNWKVNARNHSGETIYIYNGDLSAAIATWQDGSTYEVGATSDITTALGGYATSATMADRAGSGKLEADPISSTITAIIYNDGVENGKNFYWTTISTDGYTFTPPAQSPGNATSSSLTQGTFAFKTPSQPDDPPGPGPDDPSIVPEPTTVALLALGLAAFGLKRKIA